MPTAYVSHSACLAHDMFPGHPERPERVQAIEDQLIASRLFDLLLHHDAPRARRSELTRVHSQAYLDYLIGQAPQEGRILVDPDTWLTPHTFEAALRAAGAVIMATDLVVRKECDNAFCNVRPPGHHAQRARAMGFCFLNNIAIGVAHALHVHGIERVAVLDFDAHHGNGTEAIFEEEPRVMICSFYQHPLYPHTSNESVDGHIVNVPLAPGMGGNAFRTVVEERWRSQIEAFEPQMLFISAGFDGHPDDPLTDLNLSVADYAWATRFALEIADRYANGRIVSALEGGYALGALARCATAHVKALMRV